MICHSAAVRLTSAYTMWDHKYRTDALCTMLVISTALPLLIALPTKGWPGWVVLVADYTAECFTGHRPPSITVFFMSGLVSRLIETNALRLSQCVCVYVHRVPKKTKQICFCQNFVKFPPILIIFGKKMGNDPNICEMHSFFTSPNLCCHTTVLNADVPNCYKTL